MDSFVRYSSVSGFRGTRIFPSITAVVVDVHLQRPIVVLIDRRPVSLLKVLLLHKTSDDYANSRHLFYHSGSPSLSPTYSSQRVSPFSMRSIEAVMTPGATFPSNTTGGATFTAKPPSSGDDNSTTISKQKRS